MFADLTGSMTLVIVSISVSISAVAVLVVVLHAVATRVSELQPAAIGSYQPSAQDTASLTIAQTPFVAQVEWQTAMLSSLSEAEYLLDRLENNGIEDREIMIFGDSSFAVRWK